MALHADAVAQDGAPAEGTGGIDRQNADTGTIPPKKRGNLVYERALTDSRGTREANHVSPAGMGVERSEDVSGTGDLIVNITKEARCRPQVSGNDPFGNAHAAMAFQGVGDPQGTVPAGTTGL